MGGPMKTAKNLLLSSAATIVVVGGAQAADLPVRAQAVEYVKICSLYGDGFYYIPGTSTCIQFSGVAQWEVGYNVGSGQGDLAIGSLTSFAPAATTNAGDNSRMTGRYQQRARMGLATDVRWQTDYGTLRAFGSFRADYVDQQNLNGGTSIAADRAFVQWAGWTVGRVQSLSDVPNLGPLGPQVLHRAGWIQKETGASGNKEISYTWELGNGMSFSAGAGERQVKPISNMSLNSGFALGSSSNATRGLFSPEDQLFDQHAGQTLPNPFVAFKINQAWGAFGVSVNGNYNRALNYGSQATGGGGFFQSELSTATAGLPPFAGLANEGFAIPGVSPSHGDPLGTNNQGVIGIPGYAPSLACIQSPQSSFCGYPKDKWGGAVNVGASINAPWIAAGDKFGGMFAYGIGATSYVAGVLASP